MASSSLKLISVFLLGLLVSACQQENDGETSSEPVIRGLKTVLVQDQEQSTVRRYPSVLQPSEVTTLSFETPGKLGAVDLKVGQVVAKGDLLAQLDRRSLEIQVETAESALLQSNATAKNAAESFKRLDELFKKKVTTKAKVDDARTSMETSAASVRQAEKQLENARENLSKADLKSPINGVINSVEVESFANVSAGAPVATLYRTDGFETSFSVSYEVIQQMAVGKQVTVRLADNPSVTLVGIVNELGSRADTVSSFPLVVKLSEVRPELKAGMAVEVSINLPVPTGDGFLLPLTVLPMTGQIDPAASPNTPGSTQVFVFDAGTQTVSKRQITIGGVRENRLIVINGLNAGERVASAGVSFLRDGQEVKLLDTAE
ncbi:MAG: efflux RND transporter periplasmic adaptor subunit [Pseudomonadota bacterium]